MPLLNKKLLQETVNKHKHEIASTTKQDLQALFKDTLTRIETKKFKKEESEKVSFLQKMFELLGYKLHENLEFEYSTSFGRSIDGVLGLQTEKGRDVEIAIEWKGIDTKNLDKGKAGETPVSQMWDYMGKVEAEIGIVGNFLELRIYTLKTKQTEYQEYFLRELSEKEDKLDEFIFLLKKQTLLKNDNKQSLLENLISQSEAQQAQITKDFYNDYKQRRLNLFEHLVETNPETNKHILVEKSQKILDRLIFVMFCEDGFLLPSGIFKSTFNLGKSNRSRSEVKIWEQFQYLFEDIDKGRYDVNPQINGFNGGLFAEDLELNSLIIKDEIWKDLIKLAEYDFQSDLNVNILGHIFEQSISDIEEIKNEIEGETTDKKKSKRKKDGIYYTPEYITDYIVSETVGGWLSQESNALEQIKILDPAGGSGAFPNQVHSYLAKKHAENANQKAIESGLETFATIDETQIDKSILKNNIFMVDLQPESVEIAKLSLWLKTAKKDQKLNNLDENVKCGNSLINDPQLAGNTAFNWNQEFLEVMANGGFDIVVGNPPYVLMQPSNTDEKTLNYFKENYEVATYKIDLFHLFIEKGVKLLNDGGYLGFITPNTYLTNKYIAKLRQFILDNCEVKQIILFEEAVFPDASVDTSILIIKKTKNKNPENEIEILKMAVGGETTFLRKIKQKTWEEDQDKTFNVNEKKEFNLVNCVELGSIGKTYFGIQAFDKKSSTNLEKIDTNYLPLIDGGDVFERQISVANFYFNFKEENIKSGGDWEIYKKDRIVIRQIGKVPEVGFCKSEILTSNTIYNLYLTDESFDLRYILAVLSSDFIKEFWLENFSDNKQLFPKVKGYQLGQLPIPKATTEQQTQIAELVDQIMLLKSESQNLINTFLKLIVAKYKPAATSTKLKNWHKLDIADFLDELKKQKAVVGGLPAEAELIAYFDEQKAKVLELEKEVKRVDGLIESLIRGVL